MKLDVSCMRYLGKDDFRVMTAIETGMRNHDLVSEPLINSLSKLKHGGLARILSTLLRYKLVAHANQEYNGYRLSYLGYDILALHTLLSRGVLVSVGGQIGIGKESDIFEAQDADGNDVVIKIHRLGRTSFRAVRRSRDYTQGKFKCSWLFLSRLAASKEYAFMTALHAHGLPTPTPIDQNRHIVAMSRIKGSPISQIRSGRLSDPASVFDQCLLILTRLTALGLIHCDFNEFNLLLDDASGRIILIDFPQMVANTHPNAEDLFERDLNGLVKFFATKMRHTAAIDALPRFAAISSSADIAHDFSLYLSDILATNGFSAQDDEDLRGYIENSADDGDTESIAAIEDDDDDARADDVHNNAADDDAAADCIGDDIDDDGVSKSVQEVAQDSITASATPLIDARAIRERVQRGWRSDFGRLSRSSRNATKKRNKYGKVVRISLEA